MQPLVSVTFNESVRAGPGRAFLREVGIGLVAPRGGRPGSSQCQAEEIQGDIRVRYATWLIDV